MKKQDEETAGNKDRDRLLARVLEECLDAAASVRSTACGAV